MHLPPLTSEGAHPRSRAASAGLEVCVCVCVRARARALAQAPRRKSLCLRPCGFYSEPQGQEGSQ